LERHRLRARLGQVVIDADARNKPKGSAANSMTSLHTVLVAAAALGVTVAAMLALRPIAYVVDLLDRPGGHKTHHGEVPVIGGLAMLLGLVVGLCSTPEVLGTLSSFLVSATVLVVVGMLDDRFGLPPTTRLVAQFAAVLPMYFGAGVRLENLGDLLGNGALHTGAGSFFVTATVTVAAINSFNMLDGLDGVAGGVAFVSLAWILSIAIPAAGPVLLIMAAALMGCVAGFLVFNLPVQANRRMRCFMGDAGSTLLGFSIAWLCIGISQEPNSRVSPIMMVWLSAVPATDLVWTTLRRLARGRSPLRPDTEHLHHLLRHAGFGVRAAFGILIAIAALFGSIGYALNSAGVPERWSLWLLILCGSALVFACRSAHKFLRLVPKSLRRAPPRYT
jgi:UDP-GlcNAc:undecaprenyl-phosphate GlcNAc-1-phosphate transferase